MPISPNLLISPQEKAAVSDTQLSQACCCWENNDGEGGRLQPTEIHTHTLSFFFLRVVAFFLQQLVARAVKCCPDRRAPPTHSTFVQTFTAPHPLVCTWAHLRTKPSIPEIPGMCHYPFAAKMIIWQITGQDPDDRQRLQVLCAPQAGVLLRLLCGINAFREWLQ